MGIFNQNCCHCAKPRPLSEMWFSEATPLSVPEANHGAMWGAPSPDWGSVWIRQKIIVLWRNAKNRIIHHHKFVFYVPLPEHMTCMNPHISSKEGLSGLCALGLQELMPNITNNIILAQIWVWDVSSSVGWTVINVGCGVSGTCFFLIASVCISKSGSFN